MQERADSRYNSPAWVRWRPRGEAISLSLEESLSRIRSTFATFLLSVLLLSCGRPSADLADEPRCMLPTYPDTVRTDGNAVLLVWEFPDDTVYSSFVLPADSAYLAYRDAIRADGADVRFPVADQPTPTTDEEAAIWSDEHFNGELARSGEAGIIEPIRCLDALLFAWQHSRVSQLEHPTEFLASVLQSEENGESRLAVVFGSAEEMYPPKTVYGFDVVDEYVAMGWRYRYALHNHTIQRNGELLALGTPALSTSDVQLTRNLATGAGLESARVTNGFYTYLATAEELGQLRSR